ncbi:MAG: MutS-related protein [Planctomycetota bacterium]|jgi:hypothetical protein
MNAMSATDKIGKINEFIAQTTLRRKKARTVETALAWTRLLTFAAAIGAWFTTDQLPWAALLSGSALAMFALAVRAHLAAKSRRELIDDLLTICNESLARLGGQVALIRDFHETAPAASGAELPAFLTDGPTWKLSPQEHGDLDFHAGPVGLFGLLNRTSTIMGRRRLQQYFHESLLASQAIRTRQQAVEELAGACENRWRIMAAVTHGRLWEKEVDKLVRAVRHAVDPMPPVLSGIMRWWSIISFAATIYVIYRAGLGNVGWIYAFVVLFAVNATLYFRMKRKLDEAIRQWKSTAPAVSVCATGCRIAAEDLPEAGALNSIRGAVSPVVDKRVLHGLFRALAWTESGGIFHVICNLLYFFDLHIVHAVHRRAIPNRDVILHAMSALAELEALCSLACFAWEQPDVCFPTLADNQTLTIGDGTHPLIEPDKAVANSVALGADSRIWIVTGSNMAGKSTLLRMTGANVLLAQMGSCVSAKNMTLSPMRLITDLQAHDSLADGESYFLAEVRHLKRLVAPPDGRATVLGIVDEPLRGTNSPEQTAASIAVVNFLKGAGQFFLIATHDHAITGLADESVIRNVHFREMLEESGMTFDYQLRTGPATTRNALRVLQREGFPQELLEHAQDYLKQEFGPHNPV